MIRNHKSASTRQSGRLFAIGDVHGEHLRFAELLEKICPNSDDTLVFLGDVINRGPNTKEVLNGLIDLKARCELYCVLGNHEEVLLRARNHQHDFEAFLRMGGDATLASYGTRMDLNLIPNEHWELLETFVDSIETEKFAFVHANYCWYLSFSEQPSDLLRWISMENSVPREHISGKVVVCGHSPGPVRDLGYCICIDTGCGHRGNLTAVELYPSRLYLSTD